MGLTWENENERRADFWEMQHALNNVSSEPPSYLKFCQLLGLDPNNPILTIHGDSEPEPPASHA